MVSESTAPPTAPMLKSTLLSATKGAGPRRMVLEVAGRTADAIETPHYVALASRGSIPHLAPDVLRKTDIKAVYLGLEDYIERAPRLTPPVYKLPSTSSETSSALRGFSALPQNALTILAPRRQPAVTSPAASTNSSISVLTSVGFRNVEVSAYTDAVARLRPDIVVGMADVIPDNGIKPSAKRVERTIDRTHDWTSKIAEALAAKGPDSVPFFAPIPPVAIEKQQLYLSDLATDESLSGQISGLALYDATHLPTLESTPALEALPRLLTTSPSSPHEVLQNIAQGADILTIPFVNTASDLGVALTFSFPAPTQQQIEAHYSSLSEDAPAHLPLSSDLRSQIHISNVSPLSSLSPAMSQTDRSCPCGTCSRPHNRAYLNHLLNAREMLAWTLLQLHNHTIMDSFFAGVRASIANGTFEAEARRFNAVYDDGSVDGDALAWVKGSGEGPRVRGHMVKSEKGNGPDGQGKRNRKGYGRLVTEDEQDGKVKTHTPHYAVARAEADKAVAEMDKEEGLDDRTEKLAEDVGESGVRVMETDGGKDGMDVDAVEEIKGFGEVVEKKN